MAPPPQRWPWMAPDGPRWTCNASDGSRLPTMVPDDTRCFPDAWKATCFPHHWISGLCPVAGLQIRKTWCLLDCPRWRRYLQMAPDDSMSPDGNMEKLLSGERVLPARAVGLVFYQVCSRSTRMVGCRPKEFQMALDGTRWPHRPN